MAGAHDQQASKDRSDPSSECAVGSRDCTRAGEANDELHRHSSSQSHPRPDFASIHPSIAIAAVPSCISLVLSGPPRASWLYAPCTRKVSLGELVPAFALLDLQFELGQRLARRVAQLQARRHRLPGSTWPTPFGVPACPGQRGVGRRSQRRKESMRKKRRTGRLGRVSARCARRWPFGTKMTRAILDY